MFNLLLTTRVFMPSKSVFVKLNQHAPCCWFIVFVSPIFQQWPVVSGPWTFWTVCMCCDSRTPGSKRCPSVSLLVCQLRMHLCTSGSFQSSPRCPQPSSARCRGSACPWAPSGQSQHVLGPTWRDGVGELRKRGPLPSPPLSILCGRAELQWGKSLSGFAASPEGVRFEARTWSTTSPDQGDQGLAYRCPPSPCCQESPLLPLHLVWGTEASVNHMCDIRLDLVISVFPHIKNPPKGSFHTFFFF